jgi:hypothetical protein
MDNRLELDLCFNLVLTEQYAPADSTPRLLLANGFAKAEFQSGSITSIKRPGATVSQVDVVYSWWPRNKSQWSPDYHALLADRVKELLDLDPSLNDRSIVWNVVMQTGCDTREEAKKMFHGIAITYAHEPEAPVNTGDFAGLLAEKDSMTFKQPQAGQDLIREIKGWTNGFADSVVTAVLNRHPEWKNMLVVMDWTSSMYAYGGQAILWQALHAQAGGIKYFSFFNDGDDRYDKPLGKAGGIYYSESGSLENVVALMSLVRSRGDGGDIPENDFEALIKSMKRYPQFDEVVLIADNNSWVRDFDLIDSIQVPVHTIVCGNYYGIHTDYINLAYRTGGSVHTIEEDIYHLASGLEAGLVLIQGTSYTLTSDDLLVPLVENNPNLAIDK